MAVEVQIPVALAKYIGNQETLKLEGKSIQETLDNLIAKYPGLKSHLFTEKGELRQFVNIYVNDQDIRHGTQMKTPLANGDVVTIVPSIAGGATQYNKAFSLKETRNQLPETKLTLVSGHFRQTARRTRRDFWRGLLVTRNQGNGR